MALDQHQAEQALRESEERYRTLAAATFEGIAITENGIIREANEQFAKMHGYELAEVIGKPVTHFLCPEEHERVNETLLSGSERLGEFRDVCKDGSIIVVEAHGRPVTWAGRNARVSAVRDITERKRAEDALDRERDLLQTVMNSAGKRLMPRHLE